MSGRRSRSAWTSGLLGRMARDVRGVSAVEFALLAPILIAFYFGLAEFCQGFMAQKRMGHGTSMVADLVSQTKVVTKSELDDIFGIGDLIMMPFSAVPLDQRVSSVTRDANGVAKVDWSHVQTVPPPAAGAPPADPKAPVPMVARAKDEIVTVPADLIANGESVIISELTYDYKSPIDHVLDPVTKFSQTYYLRPRRVQKVLCSDC